VDHFCSQRGERRRAASQLRQTLEKAMRSGDRNAERSEGPFFGYFLWTSKESNPAAGRDRRTYLNFLATYIIFPGCTLSLNNR
jgi:hypothetical protein